MCRFESGQRGELGSAKLSGRAGLALPPAQNLSRGVRLDLDSPAHLLAEREHVRIGQGIVDELPVSAPPHESSVVQRLQMLRECPLEKPGRVHELAHRAFAALQLMQDGETPGVGECPESSRNHREQLARGDELRAGCRPRAGWHDGNLGARHDAAHPYWARTTGTSRGWWAAASRSPALPRRR